MVIIQSIIKILTIFLFLFLSYGAHSQPFDYLISKILKKDESINSSKIALEKANNDLSSTKSLYLPKIDLSMPVGKEILINNDSSNTDYNYYEFSAKISQNIYDFGSTSSKYNNAKNRVHLAEISRNNVTSNKIFEAISAYFGYMKAHEVLEFAKQSEARIREVTNLENEKVAKGAGLASNVLQSKARLAGAKSTRVRFEGDLSIARNRFYNIFRELPSDIKTFKKPNLPLSYLPKSEAEAIKLAKQNNISLNLSKINLDNSKNNIKSSKSKFFPSVKAIAELKNKRNMSGLDGTEIDQTYKLEMKYPISLGGPYGLFYKESSDYKSSMNQYMIAKYNQDQLERNLEEGIRNSWQTKNIARQNFEFLSNQANISGEFFNLAMKEVRLGNRQLIDILSSETAFINAKSSAESARIQYELAVYQLILSMGTLNENLFLNKNNKLPNNNSKINNKKQLNLNTLSKNKSASLKKNNNKKVIEGTKPKNKKIKRAETIIERNFIEDNLVKEVEINNFKDKKIKIINKEKTNITNNTNSKQEIEKKDQQIKNAKQFLNNFKLQFGAFSRKDNAIEYLKILKEFNNNIVIEVNTDQNSNLYKIKSISAYKKKQAKQLCERFINNSYQCILSKI